MYENLYACKLLASTVGSQYFEDFRNMLRIKDKKGQKLKHCPNVPVFTPHSDKLDPL